MSDYACQNKVKVTTLFFMLKNMKNATEYLEQVEFVFFSGRPGRWRGHSKYFKNFLFGVSQKSVAVSNVYSLKQIQDTILKLLRAGAVAASCLFESNGEKSV